MSTHYTATHVQLRERALGTQRSVDAILTEFAATQPERVAQLRALDWHAITRQVCEEAIAAAAKDITCTVRQELEVLSTMVVRNQPQGECIGVLHRSATSQVGLALDGTRVTMFDNLDPVDEAMGVALERAFNERTMVTALKLLGGTTVERRTTKDGAVILEVEIEPEVA